MEQNHKGMPTSVRVVSYILVAVLAFVFGAGFHATTEPGSEKLAELAQVLDSQFIGETDQQAMEDGAAAGMVASLGDQWSYYIPASQMESYLEQMENAYVGVGVTVSGELVEGGLEVLQVEPTGGAREAGILPGDILIRVDGRSIADLGMDAAKELIRGQEDTQVTITALRDGQEQEFTVTRHLIQVAVASGEMLTDTVGLVTIANFDDRCASETIAAIESLIDQGAQSLIFDVRNNPGGYKHELVQVLDYLLPEGVLFRSVSNNGTEEIDESDASCLDMPMAVLINENSYSAAEFFAAALEEYDWAVTVGNQTVGKSYYQQTIPLSDGSAVGLSVGKYCTPDGVSLAEEGGLTPQITVEVDEETAANIYGGLVEPRDDPQIQAALEALTS